MELTFCQINHTPLIYPCSFQIFTFDDSFPSNDDRLLINGRCVFADVRFLVYMDMDNVRC
jgi:hypothetical protein